MQLDFGEILFSYACDSSPIPMLLHFMSGDPHVRTI